MPLFLKLNFYLATIADCVFFGPIHKEEGNFVFKREASASLTTGAIEKVVNAISCGVDHFLHGRSFIYTIQEGLYVEGRKNVVYFYSTRLEKNFKLQFASAQEFCVFFEKVTDELFFGTKIIGVTQCVMFKQCVTDLAKMPDCGKAVLDNWSFIKIYTVMHDLRMLSSVKQQQTVLFLVGVKDLVMLATRLQTLFQENKPEIVPAEIPP